MIVLAGDVGGTHTRIGLYDVTNRNFKTLAFEKYSTKKFENLGQIVATFLKTLDVHPRAAAFGIAGPVIDGVVKTTNLPWTVDVKSLSRQIKIKRTTVVNDLVAQAHGIETLSPKDLAVIQKGRYEGLANKVVMGPGTGLGEASITQHGGDTIVVASEGGHTDFGPQNEMQIELLEFLRDKYDHVSFERILSGPGLLNIYEFMKKMKYAKESPAVKKAFAAKGADKPAVIMKFAKKDTLCKLTTDLFFSVLGAEAGNLALQTVSLSGIYLTAAIVRSNIDLLKNSRFLKCFRNKGRLSHLVKRIPVYVVKKEHLGIVGAAKLASELF